VVGCTTGSKGEGPRESKTDDDDDYDNNKDFTIVRHVASVLVQTLTNNVIVT
jgi:hypothetical protein